LTINTLSYTLSKVKVSIDLKDERDGQRLEILAHRFGLKPKELATLIIKQFLHENYWEWNVEELYEQGADHFQLKGFTEYLNDYVDRIRRTEKVGEAFRKDKISNRDKRRSSNRTSLGEEGN
jgi:hypothetical protein